MRTATVTFRADEFGTSRALISAFQELITPSTGKHFKRADIVQKRSDVDCSHFAALTLYSCSGFYIRIGGLHCGHEGEEIVDLLKFCGFDLDDETIQTIIHQECVCITLWNKKMMIH